MTAGEAWLLVAGLALGTMIIKAAGPLMTGGRELGPRATRVVTVLPAAMLAALVVTGTMIERDRLEVDASIVGVAVAGVVLWRGASIIVGVVVAAAVTALVRLAGGG